MDNHLQEKISKIWPYFSIADASAWDTDYIVSSRIPVSQRPKAILPSAKSVIVLRIPISPTILQTSPSILYKEHYNTVNMRLDALALDVSTMLDAEGYDAVPITRDGYHGIRGLKESPSSVFSHRHAAYLAGFGMFGINHTILTKSHGSRVRFVSVITSADLTPSYPATENVCINCGKCIEICPVAALTDEPYPKGFDKSLCVNRSGDLAKGGIAPCGLCIAVCPVGKSVPAPSKDFIEKVRSYKIKS